MFLSKFELPCLQGVLHTWELNGITLYHINTWNSCNHCLTHLHLQALSSSALICVGRCNKPNLVNTCKHFNEHIDKVEEKSFTLLLLPQRYFNSYVRHHLVQSLSERLDSRGPLVWARSMQQLAVHLDLQWCFTWDPAGHYCRCERSLFSCGLLKSDLYVIASCMETPLVWNLNCTVIVENLCRYLLTKKYCTWAWLDSVSKKGALQCKWALKLSQRVIDNKQCSH